MNSNIPFFVRSPHFHVIGFIDGGYARCRHCSKNTLSCLSCDGFEGQTRRMWFKEGGLNSGYIVKVKAKRETIFDTAWYQLNHASIVSGQFRKALSDLIRLSCSSKTRKVQVDHFNSELEANSWRVLGFVGASLLDPDVEIWTVELTKEQINACYVEWERYHQYD